MSIIEHNKNGIKDMKVLWFSNTMANADEYFNSELKGTGGWLKALDQSLQKHVELHVAFESEKGDDFQYKETFYHPIVKKTGFLKKVLKKFTGYIDEKEDIARYLEIIKQVNPDIIHIHGTENSFSSIIPHISIPVVVSIQGNITVYLYKFFSGYKRKYLNTFKLSFRGFTKIILLQSFSQSYNLFKSKQKIEEKYLMVTKNIIGRTTWDYQLTRVMAPQSRYFHVDEILRESFYSCQWIPHQRNKFIIHTTNGNNFYKGFETLCLALFELNKLGLDCEWRVAGISENDLIVKITKQMLKSKYPKSGLLLMGNLNEEALLDSLLYSDLYVMTSHTENSPNSLCEAMIIGMPCVSTYVGGVSSLMKDGTDGLLIQSGDPWAMAGAIMQVASNREPYHQFGANASIIAKRRHDKNAIVKSLLDAYNQILNDLKD